MQWSQRYDPDRPPTHEDIGAFIDSPLWNQLNVYLQSAYAISPKLTYSGCAGQPGWNVKYQKSGRSLCTLYPMPGFFIALVVIGAKEMIEAELAMPLCAAYTRGLFAQVPFSCGGKWLMLNVTDADILRDVQRLIALRVKPKAAGIT